MDKLKTAADWLKSHKTVFIHVAGIIVVVVLAILLWRYTHQPEQVTTETQIESETVQGVERAADNAHVPISTDQAQQAATQIKYIYSQDVQPIYTVTTTGANAEKQAQAAQEAAGADFSIVTDKSSSHNKQTDLKTLPSTSTVELNQYNVQAYKKVLHTVDVGTSDAKSIGEVGYTVSKKISKDGKYIGVGASYNFDNEKAMVKLSYTW